MQREGLGTPCAVNTRPLPSCRRLSIVLRATPRPGLPLPLWGTIFNQSCFLFLRLRGFFFFSLLQKQNMYFSVCAEKLEDNENSHFYQHQGPMKSESLSTLHIKGAKMATNAVTTEVPDSLQGWLRMGPSGNLLRNNPGT